MTDNQATFKKFEKLFNFGKYSNLIDIDFNKSIWTVFKQLKFLVAGVSISVLIREIATALLPGVLVFIILSQNFNYLIYIVIFAAFLTVVYFMEFYLAAILLNTLNFSTHYSAQKFFLTTDPINQSTRSSGQIISKVERGSSALAELAEVTFVDLLPMIATTVASLLPLYFFDMKIGLIFTLFVVGVIFFNAYSRLYVVKNFQPIGIKFEDKFKAVSVENLAQVMLIRSVFSTESQINQQKVNGNNAITKWATIWHLFHVSDLVMYFLSTASIAVLAWFLLANSSIFSTSVAIALVSNYIFAINKLSLAGSRIKKFAINKANVEDLFSFIQNFGKQTYPVLTKDKAVYKN